MVTNGVVRFLCVASAAHFLFAYMLKTFDLFWLMGYNNFVCFAQILTIKPKEYKMLPVILAIRDEEDRSYVEEVYIKYGPKLYYIANSYLNNVQDSEDCVQDVVIALIDSLEDYKCWDHRHQVNFLVKCCRCIAINKYKKRSKRESLESSINDTEEMPELELADEETSIQEMVISEESKMRLVKMIEEMDPKYGDLLFFKGFLHMKNVVIAKMLNISVNLVNVRLKRARDILLSTRSEELDEIRRK